MLDKIRYYLAREDKRKVIAQRGLARARQDHTWQRRFQRAFAEMGLA